MLFQYYIYILYIDVKDICGNCNTHVELKEHQKKIKTLNEETAATLKRNVYRNYQQFIETSREISCILFIVFLLNLHHVFYPLIYLDVK